MKKRIIILFVFFIVIFSCEKIEDEYCWDCTIYFYEKIYLPDSVVLEKRDDAYLKRCGWTEREIQKYEKYRTVEKHPISVCGDHIRWQECVCIKQENK